MKKRMIALLLAAILALGLMPAASAAEDTVSVPDTITSTIKVELEQGQTKRDVVIDLGERTITVNIPNTGADPVNAFEVAPGVNFTIKNGTLVCAKGCTNVRAIKIGSNAAEDHMQDEDKNSGSLTMENVTVKEFNVTDTTYEHVESGFGGGGAVCAEQVSTITLTNCSFLNNSCNANGGAIYLNSDSRSKLVPNDTDKIESTIQISGCTISGNESEAYGGGLFIYGSNAKLTFENNVVSKNRADKRGGGVSLMLSYLDFNGTLYFKSQIKGFTGTITGNTAGVAGGGLDYTHHYSPVLQLTNVLVTGNTAVLGGGIWACPDSETKMHSTLGGAVFGNKAEGTLNIDDEHGSGVLADLGVNDSVPATGNAIRYEGDKNSTGSTMTVSPRTLSGARMQWYKDESKNRYQAGDPEADPSYYSNTDNPFSLHGELPEEHQSLAEKDLEASKDKLIITGNTSDGVGGGIASNGPIEIGMDRDVKATVTKIWPENAEDLPKKIYVDLYRVDADGTEVLLDSGVEMKADAYGNWTVEFENLPSQYQDANGNWHEYSYTVKEKPVPGWVGTAETEYEDNSENFKITLTNTPGANGADYLIPGIWLNTNDHYSYLIGYSDGTVRPNGKITRAEVATIFFRLLDDDTRAKYWSSENDFSDVPADKWYNNAVSTLSHMGVIGGYADGTFRPNAPISRAEFAKIAVSFAQNNGSATYNYFTDVKTSDWFAPYVTAAKDAGLIEGYSDGSFKPESKITRAEACAIVNRTLGRKPSKAHMKISDRIDWPDVQTTDWFYEAIMEATNSHTYQMGKRVETWNDKLPQRDWAALETGWANAYTGNGGEVR